MTPKTTLHCRQITYETENNKTYNSNEKSDLRMAQKT